MPGMRSGMFGSRLRAGADVATSGHDAICHVDPSPDTSCGLSRARGQDDAAGVPWAAPQGQFLLLFERFAVDVLLASASISQAIANCWGSAGRQLTRTCVEL